MLVDICFLTYLKSPLSDMPPVRSFPDWSMSCFCSIHHTVSDADLHFMQVAKLLLITPLCLACYDSFLCLYNGVYYKLGYEGIMLSVFYVCLLLKYVGMPR